jgi:hypothetical protein
METTLVIVHVLLAIILFFITNWIGKHSLSVGYMQMSLLAKSDEAPAFNFLYRIFSPIVFIVLCCVLFNALSLNWINKDIYMIVAYYFVFRIIFNILTARVRLINWYTQIFYIIFSIPLAYLFCFTRNGSFCS